MLWVHLAPRKNQIGRGFESRLGRMEALRSSLAEESRPVFAEARRAGLGEGKMEALLTSGMWLGGAYGGGGRDLLAEGWHSSETETD